MRESPGFNINRFSAIALAGASVFTLCAAIWNQFYSGGEGSRAGSRTLLAVAIVLGIAGIALCKRGSSVEHRAQPRTGYRWILAVLLALHSLVAYWELKSGPPQVDCFTWQRDATAGLLRGVDPYGSSHVNIYPPEATRRFYGPGTVANGRVQVGLTYPPVTFLSALPGYLLGDVRYGYVAAILVSTLFLFALFPDGRGLLLAIFVLLTPTTFYLEYECWTEPLVWMLLCATVYTAIKRPRWLPLALGLFLASKQYNFLALPFICSLVRPFSWKAVWKLLGVSLGIGLATVLPFAVWNFRALWHDLYTFLAIVPARQDALSFAIRFPVYAKIGPLLLLVFIVWAARRAAGRAEMFAAAFGMALMLFFSASEQAFLNYYFLIALALSLSAAALWPAAGGCREACGASIVNHGTSMR